MTDDDFHPCSFVIFGATGHLAATKLLPALYHLEAPDGCPTVTNFIAFARRDWDDAAWLAHVDQTLREQLGERLRRRTCSRASAAAFRYVRGDLHDVEAYRRLLDELGKPKTGVCSNIVFYLAIKPADFARGGRAISPPSASTARAACTALVVEKPFGEDLDSAQALNAAAAPALRRAADLPHRPLPRQGDGAEPAGVPLRQPAVRAAVEPQLHRPRADHRRRARRRRDARRLLRPGRRAARHAAEPHDAAADAGGDGAAAGDWRPTRCATRR